MTYGDCFGTGIGEVGKIITNDTVLEVAAIDESINGDGGLTIGWNSTTGGGLAVGTAIGKYVLLQPYVPTKNGDGSYRYEVKFSDPIALLGKKLFYKMVTVLDKAGNTTQTPLYTFSFVGKASTVISALAEAGGVSCDMSSLADSGTISVSFDGDSIKSAAEKIGSACDVAVWYTDGCIHFGSAVDFISGEYYNHFVVLGGTKNMTKKIVTSEGEEYAAVTQRLTLDPAQYPGSVIGSGTPEMTKLLVFDNIYPKARLKVTHVYRRECWLLDEAGDKIPTAWRDDVPTAWAKYTKWYVRLGDADGEGHIDQANLERLIIDGTTLRMQFLPFAEGGTSVLAGREFELVHFTGSEAVMEKEDDDVDPNGFMAQPGMYRIVMTADCNVLLPSDALPPAVGDLVTLVNIAVPDTCYAKARQELLAAGQAVASMYGVTVPAPESYTGGGGASIGDTSGGYLVTNVHTDLITGEVQVTYGTLAQRGMIASLIDKVESAQTAGGGGTTGSNSGQGVGTMSSEQWNALAQAGGRTGLVTINERINEVKGRVDNFGADINEIQAQTDQRMQMWFGTYVPTAQNYPASQWVTDAEKQLHVEDVFYDYSREASDPNGGKVWRWTRHETTVNGETVVTYSWDEVTDAETLLAIEKIADVAYDGKLAGGSEKVRVYTQWQQAVGEHAKYNHLASAYGLVVNRYNAVYRNLAKMLNGGVEGDFFTDILSGAQAPAWLSDLNSTTAIILDSGFIGGIAFDYQDWSLDTSDAETASRVIYRNLWNEYYAQAEALDRASKVTANDAYKNVTALADDGVISAGTEKSQLLTLWRETVAEFWKFIALAEDYNLHGETLNAQNLNGYRSYVSAYCCLAWMLDNDQEGIYTDFLDNDGKFNENITNIMLGTALPQWIGSNIGTDTVLSRTPTSTASNYRQNWHDYYDAKASLMKKIETAAKTATDFAQRQLDDIADDKKITKGEKNDLLNQFTAWYNEFATLQSAKNNNTIDADAAWATYQTAFYRLAHFFDDLSNSTTAIDMAAYTPTMLIAAGTTTLTTVQASLYRDSLNGFRAARTALLAALAVGKLSFCVSATPPTTPFFVGDRWKWINHLADGTLADGTTYDEEHNLIPKTDTMMVCIQAYAPTVPTNQYTVSDYWADASTVFEETEPDPRNLLAALADRLYVLYGSDTANFPITVQLNGNSSTATPNNGNSDDDGNVASLLAQLQAMIGDTGFGIFIQTPLSPQKYDMLCVPVTCSIPGSENPNTGIEETVTGGVQIKMWDGAAWQYIQESSSSLLESLGNKILAMVFGSKAAATEAAGLSVGQRFAKLFAQATVYDPQNSEADENGFVTLSQALFGVEIEQDANGRYYSTAMISADHIDFTGYTFRVNASNINFDTSIGAGNIDFTTGNFSISAGHIDFTTGNFTINASHIDFTGYTFRVNASNINFDTSIGAGNIDFTTGNYSISAGKIDFTTGNFHIDASHITITDNGTEVAIIENGKIKASLIDVTNLNVLGALTGQTIDMQNATFQNLHVSGEVTGIVTAEQLFQNLNMGQATENYKLTMDNGDEVLISETNIATLQDYIGEIFDYIGENQDIPRTVVKVEYYGNQNTDIFYVGSSGQTIYIPNPELSEGRTIEIYNGTGGSFTLASSAAQPCTSAEEAWGSPRSDLFFYATRTSASAGDISTNAVYMKLHAGKRVESGSSVEKLYWIILERRNADGTIYFP